MRKQRRFSSRRGYVAPDGDHQPEPRPVTLDIGHVRERSVMMRRLRTILAFTAAAVAVSVAGCSSSSQNSPTGPCPDIEQVAPQLVYPAANTAGVPTTAGYIVLNAQVAEADVTLVPYPVGATLNLGPLVVNPSPVPMPTSTAATSGELFGALHPALASQTTYAVNYVSTVKGPCASVPGSSGSFTTQ